MNKNITLSFLTLACVLSACSSGEGASFLPEIDSFDESETTKVDEAETSNFQKFNTGFQTVLQHRASDLIPLEADDLPATAELSGQLALANDVSSSLSGEVRAVPVFVVGDADIFVDFSKGTLEGTADNFSEYDISMFCDEVGGCSDAFVQDVKGTLAITGETVGVGFDFEAHGELSAGGDNSTIISGPVDVAGTGEFHSIDGNLTGFSNAYAQDEASGLNAVTPTGLTDAFLIVSE